MSNVPVAPVGPADRGARRPGRSRRPRRSGQSEVRRPGQSLRSGRTGRSGRARGALRPRPARGTDRQRAGARRERDVGSRHERQVSALAVQAVDDAERRVVAVRVEDEVAARHAEGDRDRSGRAQGHDGRVGDDVTREEVERRDRRERATRGIQREESRADWIDGRRVQRDRLRVRRNVAEDRRACTSAPSRRAGTRPARQSPFPRVSTRRHGVTATNGSGVVEGPAASAWRPPAAFAAAGGAKKEGATQVDGPCSSASAARAAGAAVSVSANRTDVVKARFEATVSPDESAEGRGPAPLGMPLARCDPRHRRLGKQRFARARHAPSAKPWQ